MNKILEAIFKNPEDLKILQGKYSLLAKKGKFSELDKLIRQTGVEPQLSDKEISTLYKSSLEEYTPIVVQSLEQIRKWDKHMHKGKPTVFEGLDFTKHRETIQKGYQITIVDDFSLERRDFNKLKRLTGVAVSEETVQIAINERIKEQNVLGDYYFENVQKATGIEPVPDNSVVQAMFRKCLRDKKNGPYFWRYLVRSTGIKPEEKLAQMAYRQFVRQEKISDLASFVEFTGIVPEEETVHATYRTLVKMNRFGERFSEVQKVTDIAPKSQTVQAAYSVIVDRQEFIWEHCLQNVFKETGVTPSEDIIQRAYEICVRKCHIDKFNELYGTFKVKPSQKTRKALENFLKS